MHFRISRTVNAEDIFRCSVGCEIMLMIKARIRLIFSRYTHRSRLLSTVRPVGPWSDHFFARNGFSWTTFLAKYRPFSHVSFQTSFNDLLCDDQRLIILNDELCAANISSASRCEIQHLVKQTRLRNCDLKTVGPN